jgi:alpha-tubulin suppressor-like RCC1 family protein
LGDGSHTNSNAPVTVNNLSAGTAQVQVGINHSCVLMTGASIECWGMDGSGQLGDGVVFITPTAIDSGGFSSGVTLLGTGDLNTCALVSGLALCWGDNRNGQLGDGSLVDRPAPVLVSGLTGAVTAIDSGLNQSCVITNGGVQCWGRLDPTADSIYPPTAISNLGSGVTSLSVTNLSGCAVDGGAAMCWGDNTSGQLGNGTVSPSYTAAVPVTGLVSGVAVVSTGLAFSCALSQDHSVWCWGLNDAGQVGQDPAVIPAISVPVQVTGLPAAVALAAGQDHACALAQIGTVWCWGNNVQGQLGDGGNELATYIPVQVTGLAGGVSSLTAGGYHTCALVSGAVMCWGFNSSGQLGNGLTTLSKVPVPATGMNGMLAVNAGGVEYDQEQTCAITFSGSLKCWGGDEYGQLGDNLPTQRTSPVRVIGWSGVPELGLNYTSGAPGSFFRIAAANFPAGATLTVKGNQHVIGTIQANAEGYAIFQLQVTLPLPQNLHLALAAGGSAAAVNLTIDLSAPVHIQEGSAPIVYFANLFYMFPYIINEL